MFNICFDAWRLTSPEYRRWTAISIRYVSSALQLCEGVTEISKGKNGYWCVIVMFNKCFEFRRS